MTTNDFLSGDRGGMKPARDDYKKGRFFYDERLVSGLRSALHTFARWSAPVVERVRHAFEWRVEQPEPMRDSVQAILEDLVYINSAHAEELAKVKRRARALSEAQPDHVGDIALTVAATSATNAALALDKAADRARGCLSLYVDAGTQVSAARVRR